MIAKGVSYRRAVTVGVLACVLVVVDWAPTLADDTDDLIGDILRQQPNSAKAAEALLKSANGLADSPAVQARLCEKAYERAIVGSAGYASALAALDMLVTLAPDRIARWDDMRLEVHRLMYVRGDRKDKLTNGQKYVELLLERADLHGAESKWSDAAKLYGVAYGVARTLKLRERPAIYERMRDANSWVAVTNRLAVLKAALDKNPDDSRSRKRLVETYLIDLDMPVQAAKHLSDALDATLRTNVSLAAREAAGLADADFLTLGQWYQSLAIRTAGNTAKTRLLVRARDNLKMYLEVYTKEDIHRLRATKALATIEADLKRLDAALTAKPAKGQPITLKLGKGVTMKFVYIPAGKFPMGSSETEKGRERNEGPQRWVTISRPFYMGVTEVTQAQYAAVTGKNPSNVKAPENPVERVSWDDCVAFCQAMSKATGRSARLPTEAEWEYACRAGTKTPFSFGADDKAPAAHAWYEDISGDTPHPVGGKKPNAWGVYDMHGNVWEWCSDWYDSYASAEARDPKGPATGKERILRGGAWGSPIDNCRSAYRNWNTPVNRSGYLGLRVVVEYGSEKK